MKDAPEFATKPPHNLPRYRLPTGKMTRLSVTVFQRRWILASNCTALLPLLSTDKMSLLRKLSFGRAPANFDGCTGVNGNAI